MEAHKERRVYQDAATTESAKKYYYEIKYTCTQVIQKYTQELLTGELKGLTRYCIS